jgi:hypothetical protein
MDDVNEKGLLPLAVRVRSEYLEMPGLRLTPAQAGRLLGLDSAICTRLLAELVSSGFLRIGRDGHYVRADAA